MNVANLDLGLLNMMLLVSVEGLIWYKLEVVSITRNHAFVVKYII